MDLSARPVSDKSSSTAIRCSNQEAGYGIDAVVQALSPLKNPVEGQREILCGAHSFYMRMNINEVDWSGPSCCQDAKIVSLGVNGIEGAQRVRRWMVSA